MEIIEKPTIAAFDFDGTISYHDTLLPFLLDINGIFKTYFYLFLELPFLLGFIFKITSRTKVKEKVLTRFFKGIKIEELNELGIKFAKTKLPHLVRPEALERIKWHKEQNHICVLISASLDVYLKPWAESIGFNDILTSSLDIDSEEYITGKLKGLNCWGNEKVRRLQNLYGSKENYTLYAYGDSLGDQELLKYADYPFYKKLNG